MKAVGALALCCASVLLTPRAHAQSEEDSSGVDDEARTQARALVDQAVAAFEAGEYQTALGHFRAGYDLVALHELRFNIAMCYERLARPREAAAEYEALIDSSLSDTARRRARQAVERLRSRFATLQFSGARGVVVRVDGEMQCTVPCELTANPGRHLVEGLGPQPRSVELAEGEVLALRAIAPPEPERPSPMRLDRPEEPSYSPGPLLYTGVGVTLLGVAGIIGFGLAAQNRNDEFNALPSDDLANEGAMMRDVANASIGVAVLGAALIFLDVVLGD